MQTRKETWQQTLLAIDSSVEHADAVIPSWSDNAFALLVAYLGKHDGEFCSDQVRSWATNNGLEEPPNRHAWGAVMLRAKREGLIKKNGMGTYHFPDSPNTHGKPTNFWINTGGHTG